MTVSAIGGQRLAEIIERHGRMRDVVQEGVAGPEAPTALRSIGASWIALDEDVVRRSGQSIRPHSITTWAKPFGPVMKLP